MNEIHYTSSKSNAEYTCEISPSYLENLLENICAKLGTFFFFGGGPTRYSRISPLFMIYILVEAGEVKGPVAKKSDVSGNTVILWWKHFARRTTGRQWTLRPDTCPSQAKLSAPKLLTTVLRCYIWLLWFWDGQNCFNCHQEPAKLWHSLMFLRQPFRRFPHPLPCIGNSFHANNVCDFERGTRFSGPPQQLLTCSTSSGASVF